MDETEDQEHIKCLVCDKDTKTDKAFSIFNSYIPETLKLLHDSFEELFSLKRINSENLRSKHLCSNCHDCLIKLQNCYNKFIELKSNFWSNFKNSCEKYNENYCDFIVGVATQTSKNNSDNDNECSSEPLLPIRLKVEKRHEYEENNSNKNTEDDNYSSYDEQTAIKKSVPSEEITIEADLDLIRLKTEITGANEVDIDTIKRRRPESCKICGKWFKKILDLDNHMLIHSSEDRQKVSLVNFSKKKKNVSCSVCEKKFRKPCELKDHMSSHKSIHPFVCKLCDKNLKTKASAAYHASKVHKIDVSKEQKIEEHFNLDVPFTEDEKNAAADADIDKVENNDIDVDMDVHDGDDDNNDNDDGGGGGDDDEHNDNDYDNDGDADDHVDGDGDDEVEDTYDSVVVDENGSSSSEDELPLARRRKEFIFEKIKKKIITDKPVKEAPVKQKTIQKLALQTLKKSCEISVTKVTTRRKPEVKDLIKRLRLKPIPIPKQVKDPDKLNLVVKNINDEEIRSKIAVLSKTNEVTIENKALEQAQKQNSSMSAAEANRNRIKKYSLNTLLKLKRQKDAGLLYPTVKEAKFECDVCHKMWKSRGELNAHKQTHSDARPYICEICGQAYKHKPALDVHVGMHKGIYQHQCPYCQKAFTQKGALQRHLPIHTGDLPYQCELCGKRFVHRTSFSIHTMAHTGVRNIRCKVCNLGVLSKSHLRRHMRIHTGEKPYDCQTCGKAFAERYNLVAHQRIHDPNLVGPARQQKRKLQTCRLCTVSFDRRHKLEEHMVSVHNKVVEEPQTRMFEVEGYTNSSTVSSTRPGLEIYSTDLARKGTDLSQQHHQHQQQQHTRDEDDDVKSEVNDHSASANDLSVKNMQLRNWELLRSFENTRGFELIRMANGGGSGGGGGASGEEGIRIPGAVTGTPWGYVNPHS